MRQTDPVLQLIAAIYDAVGNPGRWSSTTESIREHLRSTCREQDADGNNGSNLAGIIEPHLKRAAKLHRRLIATVQQHVPGEFLDRFDVGLVLLDSRTRVVWANRAASRVLARGDGLKVIGSRLQIQSPRLQHRLRALLDQAGKTLAEKQRTADLSLVVPRLNGGRPYQMLIVSLVNGDIPVVQHQATLAVLFSDPESVHRPPELLLRELFGLTPTEARVAALLTGGQAIRDLSAQFRVSEESIRWHVKGIFAKTGVSSQAQLVRLVLTTFSLPGDFSPEPLPQAPRVPPRKRRTRGNADPLP